MLEGHPCVVDDAVVIGGQRSTFAILGWITLLSFSMVMLDMADAPARVRVYNALLSSMIAIYMTMNKARCKMLMR